jgi:nucleoside-diphosphate-sugar epimerase
MQTDMKIAVAGATGRVGRHLVDVLEARGYEVESGFCRGSADMSTGESAAEQGPNVTHGMADTEPRLRLHHVTSVAGARTREVVSRAAGPG